MDEPEPEAQKQSLTRNFTSDVLKLVTGTSFAQVISVLAGPILTRLYVPEAFGISATFISISTILITISCLRYERAIMLPEDDKKAANILVASFGFVILISIICFPIIAISRSQLSNWLNSPEIESHLWLISPSVFFGGSFLSLNYWFSRKKKFGRLSIAKVSQTLTSNLIQLGSAIFGFNTAIGLIGGYITGQATPTTFLALNTLKEDRLVFKHHINWSEIKEGLKRYKKFPLYSSWSALMNSISWQIPTFLLSAYFSPVIVGYYALGNRILRIPMNLIGISVAQVFFQRASSAKSGGNLHLVVENSFRYLVALGLFPMLVFTVAGKDIFIVIFGANWAEAGVYTQILSIWMFVWFISSPMSTLYSVMERQEQGLIRHATIFMSRFLSLMIGGILQDARIALLLFSLSGIITYGHLSLSIIKTSGVEWKIIIDIFYKYLLRFLPSGMLLIGLKLIGVNSIILTILSILLIGYYYLTIFMRDPKIRNMLFKIGSSS